MSIRQLTKKSILAINKADRKKIFWLCFAILVFGLVLTFFERTLSTHDLSFYKAKGSYFHIASNLTDQGSYSLYGVSPTAYRPPLYPLYLYLTMLVFGESWQIAGVLGQFILGILIGLLTLLIAKRSSERNLTLLTTILLLIANRFFMYEVLRLRDTILFVFFALLFLYFFQRHSLSDLRLLLLALFGSLAYLTRPPGIVFFALIFIILLKDFVQTKRWVYLRKILFFALMALLITSPWYYYLYKNFDNPLLFPSSTAGINLHKGNNKNLFSYYPWVDVDRYSPLIKEFVIQQGIPIQHWPPEGQFENAVDSLLRKQATKYILSHPIEFILRSFVKLAALYSPLPTPLGNGKLIKVNDKVKIDEFRFRIRPTKLIGTFCCAIYILGAALLLTRNTRYVFKNNLVHLVLFLVLTTVLYMITFSETRFRLTIDPVLIILGSIYWSNLLNNYSARRDLTR